MAHASAVRKGGRQGGNIAEGMRGREKKREGSGEGQERRKRKQAAGKVKLSYDNLQNGLLSGMI